MRKTLVAALLALVAININAAGQNENVKSNKPVFTVVKQIPITSIKDQNRSGTCWDYSTLSYFEAEILKKTGKTYDLCESFVANKTYMDRATQVVRLHKVDQPTMSSIHLNITASVQRVLCLSLAHFMAIL